MTVMLERPSATRPWWHIRPSERRPLAWIVGVGGPVGFLAGALLGIFLQVPGPAGPTPAPPAAGRGTPVLESVAPPASRSAPVLTRPRATGSDVPTRRAGKPDATRSAASSPTGHAPTAPTIRTTVTVTSTPPATATSTTAGNGEELAPEGGVSPGASPS